MERNLFHVNWEQAGRLIKKCEGVVIPFGSVEEHGHHLPLGTDTILTEVFTEQLCQDLNLCWYPSVTFGQVWSARDFDGTISINPDVLRAYGREVVKSVARFAPGKIFLFSFHNGNHKVLDDILRDIYAEDVKCPVYHVSMRGVEAAASEILDSPYWNKKVWHAGELETSLMLYVKEEAVDMSKAVSEYPKVPAGYENRAVPWRTFSKSGAFGDAAAATKEKGEVLYQLLYMRLREQVFSILEEVKDE